jgi:formylglycine-generating enzyme required for sulfatase activity
MARLRCTATCTRAQLHRVVGLAQEVVGARRQAAQQVLEAVLPVTIRMGSMASRAAAHPAAELVAVHAGHAAVGQHHVEIGPAQAVQPSGPARA